MTLCGHRPVTLVLGHRWIPIWRPYGRDRLRVFLQPCQSTAFCLVTRGGPPGSSYSGHVPCLAPASGVFPQFTGNLCAQTLHSSSRRGWRDRSVLSRRPRQPSRAAVAAPLRDPYDLTTPTSSSGCWPYRHTQEASSGIQPGLTNARPASASMAGPTRRHVLNLLTRSPSQRALQR